MTYRVVYASYSNELYHHGIKGQKWGIRRYQNKDGTLTPEGIKKYRTVDNFNKQRKLQRERNIAIAKKIAKATATAAVVAVGSVAAKKALDKIKYYLPAVSSDQGLTFGGSLTGYGPRPQSIDKNRHSFLTDLMWYFMDTGDISPTTTPDMFNQIIDNSRPGKPRASIANVSIQAIRQGKFGK